jgi:hypothetical protein
MRIFLILWIVPIVLMTIWYGLASNDFGYVMFSREVHDKVFAIYANMLGVDPEVLPGMAARAIVFDSGIVALIIAFKKRATLIPFLRQLFSRSRDSASASIQP